MDIKRINAAVKVKLAYDRLVGSGKKNQRRDKLATDLIRLIDGMDGAEWNEYQRRIKW